MTAYAGSLEALVDAIDQARDRVELARMAGVPTRLAADALTRALCDYNERNLAVRKQADAVRRPRTANGGMAW